MQNCHKTDRNFKVLQ